MTYPPPGQQPPTEPFAAAPPPPSTPPPPPARSRSYRSWLIPIAAGAVALAAIVVGLVISGGSGDITDATDAVKDQAAKAKEKQEDEASYRIDEGLCGNINLDPLDGKVKLENDALDERVHELNALACTGFGKSYEDGSVGIIVGAHSDATEAEKAFERRKGEVFVTGTLSDLDGTDWDQAEFNSSTIGSPGLLVQHGNLELAIDIGLSEKHEDLSNDDAKTMLKELAGNILKAVKQS